MGSSQTAQHKRPHDGALRASNDFPSDCRLYILVSVQQFYRLSVVDPRSTNHPRVQREPALKPLNDFSEDAAVLLKGARSSIDSPPQVR